MLSSLKKFRMANQRPPLDLTVGMSSGFRMDPAELSPLSSNQRIVTSYFSHTYRCKTVMVFAVNALLSLGCTIFYFVVTLPLREFLIRNSSGFVSSLLLDGFFAFLGSLLTT